MMDGKATSRIYILGAGAVGCFYGGLLSSAGHEVNFVVKPQHLESFQGYLNLEWASHQTQVKVRATTELKDLVHADILIVAVKSADTLPAIQSLKEYLPENIPVLSFQNGVTNAKTIAAEINNPVYPVVVYVATAMQKPWHVKHYGRGDLLIGQPELGRSNAVSALVQLFNQAQIKTEFSESIEIKMWEKFLVNCTYNAVSAMGQISYGEMVKNPQTLNLLNDLRDECLLVAHALAIPLSQERAAELNQQIAQGMAQQKSSMAQDLMKGRQTEIDYLNGYLVREAQRLGLSLPKNEVVCALIKMLEHKNNAS